MGLLHDFVAPTSATHQRVHMRQCQPSLWLAPPPYHIPSGSVYPSHPSWQTYSPSQALSSLPSASSLCSMVCLRPSLSPYTCRPYLLQGVYLVLLTDCIKVLINKQRRRAGGNLRLILPVVSITLFLLITWVSLFPDPLLTESDGLLLASIHRRPSSIHCLQG
jgi:hypothetical protein